MVMDSLFLLMESSMKDIMLMIRKKDMAFLNGQMVNLIQAIGKMVNSMEKEFIHLDKENKN